MSAPSVLVVGLGRTGLSLVRHWAGRAAALEVADTRESPPGLGRLRAEFPGVAFRHAGLADIAAMADGRDIAAVSPGVPAAPFAGRARRVVGDVSCLVDAIGEADPAARPALIAVTGTNGKSTVTRMAERMLRAGGVPAEAIGNIGLPALDAHARWARDGDWPRVAVLEVSSFQLETAGEIGADVATALNVSDDHLDRHGTLQAYAAVKERVYLGARVAVVNRSDIFCAAMRHAADTETGFAEREEDARDGDWRTVPGPGGAPALSDGRCAPVALPSAGLHPALRANVLAAMALTGHAGIDPEVRAASLDGFRSLPHRMSRVAQVGGVDFYDDSKATNVGAAIAALRAFDDGRTVVIAGGDGKMQQFGRLAAAARDRARHFVLIGADAGGIAAALDAESVPHASAADMGEAVALAFSLAPDPGRVLLSPACSSLDMYADFAARGDEFASLVRAMAQGHDTPAA